MTFFASSLFFPHFNEILSTKIILIYVFYLKTCCVCSIFIIFATK